MILGESVVRKAKRLGERRGCVAGPLGRRLWKTQNAKLKTQNLAGERFL
jgi:hypothetical protein